MSQEIPQFDKGDRVLCSGEFRDAGGELVDPATVTFKVKKPGGSITTYTYGLDVELVKDAVGKYRVEVDVDISGTWFYRFEGTGAAKSAGESEFIVKRSQF
jgi:hypothetical protein